MKKKYKWATAKNNNACSEGIYIVKFYRKILKENFLNTIRINLPKLKKSNKNTGTAKRKYAR